VDGSDQTAGAEPQRIGETRLLGKRDTSKVGPGCGVDEAVRLAELAEHERAEALDKIAAALNTPEQGDALRNIAVGKGDPLKLVRKLCRPGKKGGSDVIALLDPHRGKRWPVPDTPLVDLVWALGQLPDAILTDVESGGTTLDRAVFVVRYAQHLSLDREEFYCRAIAELKSLDAAKAEPCGCVSSDLAFVVPPRRCERCRERDAELCELRIIETIAGAMLAGQKTGPSLSRRRWYERQIHTGADQNDHGGDRGVDSGIQAPGRKRQPEKPLNKKNGRMTVATAVWDVIGMHEEWSEKGVPLEWSDQEAADNINRHLQKLIKQKKIVPEKYDSWKPNPESKKYEFSARSVNRVIPRPRQRSCPASRTTPEQSGSSASK
jgi:hypothetical protein